MKRNLFALSLIVMLAACALSGCNMPSPPTGTPWPTVTPTIPAAERTAAAQQAQRDSAQATGTARSGFAAHLTQTVQGTYFVTPLPTPRPIQTLPFTPPAGTTPTFNSPFGVIGGEPLITFFRADPPSINPGDVFIVSWETRAETVTLCTVLPDGLLGPCGAVAQSGSQPISTQPTDRSIITMALFAQAGSQQESAQVMVTLGCPDAWYFTPAPAGCAQGGALIGEGAAQEFQHGRMIWLGPLNAIFVLYTDPQALMWDRAVNGWADGMMVEDPNIIPPEHLWEPVRGFGMAWRGEGGIAAARDRLGWAKSEEYGFGTAYQCDASGTCYLQAPDGVIVLRADRGEWHSWP
jgi:hypothetical protein